MEFPKRQTHRRGKGGITSILQELDFKHPPVLEKVQMSISQVDWHLRLSCGLRGIGNHVCVEEEASAHSYTTETTNYFPVKRE